MFFPIRFKISLFFVLVFCISLFTVFPISAQEVIIGDSANISVKNIEYEVSNVPGEDSTLLIIVENIGNKSGTYDMNVIVDEITIGKITGELVGRALRTHMLFPGKLHEGEHVIRSGEMIESIIVPSDGVKLNDLKLTSNFIAQGESIFLSGFVSNTSVFTQKYSYPVFLNGKQIEVVSGELPIGKRKGFLIDVTTRDEGFHSVSLGSGFTSVFGVLPPIINDNVSIQDDFVEATAKAFDFNGNSIEINNNFLEILYANDNLLINFPINILPGQKLFSFTEPKRGIHYQDNEIRLRLTRERQVPEIWILAKENIDLLGNDNNHVFENSSLLITHAMIPLSTAENMPDLLYVDVNIPTLSVMQSFKVAMNPKVSMDPLFSELLSQSLQNKNISFRSSVIGLDIDVDGIDYSLNREVEIGVNIDQDWMSSLGGYGNFRFAAKHPLNNIVELFPVAFQQVNDDVVRVSSSVPSIFDSLWLIHVNEGINENPNILSLTLDSTVIGTDETAVLRIVMENPEENTYKGILPIYLNSIPFKYIPIELQASQSYEFSTNLNINEGTHVISVYENMIEFEVANPLSDKLFIIDDLRLDDVVNQQNKTTDIVFNIVNTGEITGLASKMIEINGQAIKIINAIIAPGEKYEIREEFLSKIPGEYLISIDDQTITHEVEDLVIPPLFSIENLELPKEADPGSFIEVKYRLNNHGGTGIFQGTLMVGNTPYVLQSVPITSFSSIPIVDEIVISESGELTVQFMDQETVIVMANASEIDMNISDLKISPLSGEVNKPLMVSATIYNTGSFLGTDSIVLKVNGLVVDQDRIWVAAGSKKNISFEYIPTDSGWDQIDINGVSISIEIVSNIPRYIVLFALVGFILFIVTTYFALYSYKSKRIAAG